jgi:hypothetical protein
MGHDNLVLQPELVVSGLTATISVGAGEIRHAAS